MKKLVWSILILLMSISASSQSLYVKLKQPVEQSQVLLDKVSEQYDVDFVKSERTSRLLNAFIYKIVHSLNETQAKELYQLLEEDQHVTYASLIVSPEPPSATDIPPTTLDFLNAQGYLRSNPGVDADYAWTQGADGSNVFIRFIEFGMNPNHEEFAGREAGIADGMTIAEELDEYISEHGTATAGVIFGHDGDYGVKGIAYNAEHLILYPEWQEGPDADRIAAVTRAIDDSSPGDVIVYEMQSFGPNGRYAPAEYDPLVWDLTKAATNNGVVIVAAAGNGTEDLDSADYNDYMNRGDSGAIIVGASWDNINHEPISVSTFGSRVNINAWGSGVFTSGYGGIQFGDDFNQSYTSNWGGTSSATAIAGGCVAALQSYYYTISGGQYLSSEALREILVVSGIPQQVSLEQSIGSFIDMKAAIEQLNILSNTDDGFSSSFLVYPNPTEGEMTILNTKLENARIEMYTVLGKQILSRYISQENTRLDISAFSQGVYFVKIIYGSKSAVKRIIKN